MTPFVPIVPLVIAGYVAWRLVTRTHEPAKRPGRSARRSSSARAPASRAGHAARSRKKRNGG